MTIPCLSTFERLGHRSRNTPRHCEADGCKRATQGGKPYCTNHVDLNPYVSDLVARISQREQEEARVRRQGARAVTLDGITSTEILGFLSVHGSCTVERLAHELNMDARTLRGYLQAHKRRGLITLSRNRRGSTVVDPVEGVSLQRVSKGTQAA